MTDTTGLLIQGDDDDNHLRVKIETDVNGDRSIYNIIEAAGGDDVLSAQKEVLPPGEPNPGAQLFGEDGNDDIFGSPGVDTLSGGN